MTSPTSVRFTEEMKGHIALDGAAHFVMFHLTIEIPDIDHFMSDPMRAGTCIGWVGADVFGGRLPVERGDFNLFVEENAAGEQARRTMRYRLWFRDSVGHALTLIGFKDVIDDHGFDVWTDTSTLYTRILDGHVEAAGDDAAVEHGRGVITIWPRDFAKQLTTFRASGPSIGARVRGLRLFVSVFLRQLKQVYLGKGRRTQEK